MLMKKKTDGVNNPMADKIRLLSWHFKRRKNYIQRFDTPVSVNCLKFPFPPRNSPDFKSQYRYQQTSWLLLAF
jgi:hypothetical protein